MFCSLTLVTFAAGAAPKDNEKCNSIATKAPDIKIISYRFIGIRDTLVPSLWLQ